MIIEYKGKRPAISPRAFIAPTAVLIGDVRVGDDASIWWGAVLRSDQGGYPILIGARWDMAPLWKAASSNAERSSA